MAFARVPARPAVRAAVTALALAAAASLALAAWAWWPGASGEPGTDQAPAVAAPRSTQEPLVARGAALAPRVDAPTIGALIVTTAVATLEVFDRPDGAVAERLGSWSTYGSPRTLLAVSDGTDVDGWIRVQLPNRAGHAYGWVRAADVTVSSSTTRIDVYLAEHELDLSEDGDVVVSTPVAVGAPATPTPLGVYYVTDPVDLRSSPGGVYGPYILGLSGYSEVLTRFNGGAPQLAVHGTNRPSSIGASVSNGCIRVPNATILTLRQHVTLGTPVVIHASREG